MHNTEKKNGALKKGLKSTALLTMILQKEKTKK